MSSISAFTIIANLDGEPVRIRDVGRAEVGAENERSLVRVDGQVGIAIGVVKQARFLSGPSVSRAAYMIDSRPPMQ